MSKTSIAFKDCPIPYPTQSVWRAVACLHLYHDGDTLWVERDTGCRADQLIELRVTGDNWRGFDAPERFTDLGKRAISEMEFFLKKNPFILIFTKPDTEKFGRWLSPILIPENMIYTNLDITENLVDFSGERYLDLAAHLVSLGLGEWKEY